MTVDPKWDLSGVHGINRFLWAKLQEELEWDKANYNGLTPIVPAGMKPEFNDFTAPYVVYNYAHSTTTDRYWEDEETISYAIFSSSEKDIRRFINVTREFFGKWDKSAAIINDWIRANVPAGSQSHNFDYKSIHVTSTSGADPEVSEGGRADGLVMIKVKYVYDEPVDQNAFHDGRLTREELGELP